MKYLIKKYSSLYLLFIGLLSCGPQRQVLYREMYQSKIFEISIDSFKHKKQIYKSLRAVLRDTSGRYLVQYSVQAICSCVSKHINPKNHYQLATQTPFDVLLTEEDKFVFKKLSEFPAIERFCSRSFLDSAKGFIRRTKKPSQK